MKSNVVHFSFQTSTVVVKTAATQVQHVLMYLLQVWDSHVVRAHKT